MKTNSEYDSTLSTLKTDPLQPTQPSCYQAVCAPQSSSELPEASVLLLLCAGNRSDATYEVKVARSEHSGVSGVKWLHWKVGIDEESQGQRSERMSRGRRGEKEAVK